MDIYSSLVDILLPPGRMQVALPTDYPATVGGYGRYLRTVGVRHFSGAEMTTPGQPARAAALGITTLLPSQAWWPRGAALALLADGLRDLAGGPVMCRNWWRPIDYNAAVGGAPSSDHLTATAVDLYFRDVAAHGRALEWCESLYATGLLDMSLGVGKAMLHVGLYSTGGHRRWRY